VVRVTRGKVGTVGAKLRYPARLLNLAGLKLAYALGLKRVPLPVSIDVEPNNTCNFLCPHCQVPHWNKASCCMDEESFERILDQLPNLVRIKLQGMGEPLLNKYLVELLSAGEARGITMSFFTNGSICSQELATRLAGLNDTEITFSIDGASAEVFEKIRVGGAFDRVIDNVGKFTRARDDRTQPVLSAWTVVTKENVHELPRIVRLAKSLGLDRITIQTFLSDWGKESMRRQTDDSKVDPDSRPVAEALAKARIAARDCGIDVRIAYNDFYSKKRKCVWPWTGAFIAANGDVVPCCIIADSDTVKLGNVFETPFAKIWNSKAYRDFRERIKKHDLPDYCRNCYR
jgi:radical SAM protein with 4Fe4S-binding SPASM domain